MTRFRILAVILLLATSCVAGGDKDAIVEDLTTADLAGDAQLEAAVQDAAPREVSREVAPVPETVDAQPHEVLPEVKDTGLPPDQGDACLQSPKPAGCPCEAAADCESGACNDDGFQKICAAAGCTADADCAPGYACLDAACIYLWGKLCNPCREDGECASDFPGVGACLDYGPDGAYCTVPCKDAGACPDGYVCSDTGNGSVCKAQFGVCGCSDSAAAAGLETDCYVTNDLGTCTGIRKCTANGLTDCPAATPGVETCDGLDNDCDGTVDADGAGTALQKPCGIPGCALAAVQTCTAGAWSECEVPPGAELCGDGEDNDCDGAADEDWPDLGQPCTAGLGECEAIGQLVCPQEGTGPTVCNAEPGQPAPEACDGLDNDCDGATDTQDSLGCVAYFLDQDDDGWGLADQSLCLCDPAGDFAADKPGDCMDANPGVNPSAVEVCDGLDNNCDDSADPSGAKGCLPYYFDADLDGFGAGEPACLCTAEPAGGHCATQAGDCDDADAAILPTAVELCDGLDNNCDGLKDVAPGGILLVQTCYDGPDGTEGTGPCLPGIRMCKNGAWSGCVGQVLPKTEDCDGLDNDCDGLVDAGADGLPLAKSCYAGADGTAGIGDCKEGIRYCLQAKWGACLDQIPPATEQCDDADNDCDGKTDEGCDDDQDGYCDASMVVVEGAESCPEGGGDPNDEDEGVNPSASEVCGNGKDDDVDGLVDEEGAVGCSSLFFDKDKDGFGVELSKCLCAASGQYSAPVAGDCADSDPDVNPKHTEVCDDKDNDCDELIDEANAIGCTYYYLDADGDGFGLSFMKNCLCASFGAYDATKAGDCNDQVAQANPNHAETCDGIDNDCDQQVDEAGAVACVKHYKDGDGDGYGAGAPACLCAADEDQGYVTAKAGDCNDADAAVSPAGQEACDGVDNNCDGLTDLGGGGTSLVQPCYSGPAETAGLGLCHGGMQLCAAGKWSFCIGEVVPAIEVCDLLDNDCDGVADEELAKTCYPEAYSGKEPFWTAAPCLAGTTVCLDGQWTVCADFVLPAPEICADGLDNDCDGATDTPGMCADVCDGDQCDFKSGADSDLPFDISGNGPQCKYNCGYNVNKDADGNLVLDVSVNLIDLPFMWVANDSDKTISKIDTKTGKELARYNVGPECGSPSRTSVEENGSAWIGCREGSRIVKIAANKTDCVDKNGDGDIDTSSVQTAPDGTKAINMLSWTADECVLYNGAPQPPAGAPAEIANNPVPTSCNVLIRAVAVTKKNTVLFGGLEGCRDGHIWEAKYEYDKTKPYSFGTNPQVYLVDHWYTPDLTHKDWDGAACSFGSAPGGSYGYAIDKKGNLWASSLIRSQLYWLDLDQRRSCSWGVTVPYGIAIDYAGRIWLGSWNGDYPMGHVFIPETRTMHAIQHNIAEQYWWTGTNLGSDTHTRGTAVSTKASEPYAYFAISNGVAGVMKVQVLDENPASFKARVAGILRTSNGGVCGNGLSASGIGLDGEGELWLIHMEACGTSAFDGLSHAGATAVQMNPAKISGWKHPSAAADVKDVVSLITDAGSHAYTYSDFMGYQFATVVSPSGWYVQRFLGWGVVDPKYTTSWTQVEVTIKEASQSPPLYLAVRSGQTQTLIDAAPFGPDVPLTCVQGVCTVQFAFPPKGAYLDAKVILKTDDQGASVTLTGITATGKRTKL